MFLLALLLGVFIGCSVSLFIIGGKVAKSNDIGNSKADFGDFASRMLNVIVQRDRISKP
jgi:hypothetical protein